MPTPTFTPGDEKQDEKLNPGQQHADHRFSDLAGAEKQGTVDMSDFERNYGENADSSQEDANIDALRNKESEGSTDAGWTNNVAPGSTKPSRKQQSISFLKKRGGILGLLALFGIGGAGLVGVLGPLAMPISLMENMSISNDSSSTSLERRFMKVFGFSTSESDPVCKNSTKNIKCKMGRISNKAITQLEKKGVVAYFDSDATNTDKKTGYPSKNPKGYTIEADGKKINISAGDLPGYLANNPRTAAKILGVKGAFNLRVKAWSGKYITKKLYAPFGMDKKGGLADGKSENTGKTPKEKYTEALKKVREKIPGLEKLSGVADGVKSKVSDQLGKSKKGGVGYTLAVAGCIAVKAPGYIAAGVAAVQLAQILPIVNNVILSPGSKFKASGVDIANSATAQNAEDIGNLLTQKTARASDGKMTSALDSPYLQSALGVNKNKPAVSKDFTPGYSILTSGPVLAANEAKKASAPACNVIMSPAAMYTALAVDAAVTVAASATIIGGVIKVIGSLIVTEIASHVVEEVAGDAAKEAITNFAQNDKVAKAEGEQLGDVLGISGAAFFSSGGMARDLPTLKMSQLSDFAAMETENQNFQRDMDIASLSPFDITSRYTFLGSIVYDMNMSAVANGTYNTGIFSSFLNLARLPFASLSQDTNAASNFTASYCGYAADFGLNVGTLKDDGSTTPDEANTPAINMAGMPCTGITVDQAAMSTDTAITLIQNEGWLDETKTISDNATIDDLLSSGYIKSNTPLSDFIESCGNPTTGDYLFNAAGCTTASSAKSTNGVQTHSLDANGCTFDADGKRVCIDPAEFAGSGDEGVKDARSLQAISVFLLDFQAIQSINGEDDQSSGATASTTEATTTDSTTDVAVESDTVNQQPQYTPHFELPSVNIKPTMPENATKSWVHNTVATLGVSSNISKSWPLSVTGA